jgi:hypothetical protein
VNINSAQNDLANVFVKQIPLLIQLKMARERSKKDDSGLQHKASIKSKNRGYSTRTDFLFPHFARNNEYKAR